MGDISKDIKSKFPNNKIKALVNIKYTANWLSSNENDFFKPYGISPQQFNILRILRGAGKPIKVQVIKDRMIERAPNATRLMDKLCDKKFIERIRCEHDRRVVYINISKKGLELLTTIDSSKKLNFLDNLTEEEADKLSVLLDKIR
ncbi:MarR family winged helix-turn-helix transcriptional regulator [Tenacibaculum finnmarkense]|uniref:MarR family winged helix-turn-helix transcriptional regulator n=1 Tax=Tenacibaculum finnmarkense TaxID=2781243 RepID=UPI0007393A19|nr:MarR family transcriptional regulator [Tenacibaculum finnmarkense]ALU75234.1 MarR family transcriptional regulator [Tenacibaculum dicentrarchi]MBE7634841.1 MarR family transcriptional regulator [Tenacibaculum finnmarkense genomovar ulcerans]MBE7646631.1 MarR family transcriptional regulator [Tenacibaculum finnmarkense genomovar ulcerans]MBE7688834.1 MarR family transcriptional regulator [Tenacibaculum finnmarkense genomovar ulcerans]MCD8401168.1 MarR family transcriptional regulator [Tenaci